jgi:hypothetical protein
LSVSIGSASAVTQRRRRQRPWQWYPQYRYESCSTYRLIRNGELEAIDIVETGDSIAKKGHYRIKRPALNRYLENKRVIPFPYKTVKPRRSRQFPKVKNHLGL